MTILESVAKAGYLASPAQVAELAGLIFTGKRGGNTYLAVVLAYTKDALPKRSKPSKAATLKVLDKVHAELYPSVLKGVLNGATDVPDKEKNRRAIFARTAASTVRAFVKAGGDIRKLDPATVTKTSMRNYGRKVPTGTRTERAVKKAADTVERTLLALAAKDPGEAHDRIEKLQSTLEDMLGDVIKLEAERRGDRKAKGARKGKRAARNAENRASVN